MSKDTPGELVDVMRTLREHAQFLKELGVEQVALDSSAESGTSAASVPQATAAAPAKLRADTPPAFASATREAVSPKSEPQQAEALFQGMTPAEPALTTSETLEQIWTDIG